MALEKIILKKGSSTAETYTKGAIDTLLSGKQAAGNYQPAGSYATLGSDGKIPSSQLPSYVDDVLEYNSRSAFPATGEAGKIYIAKDTNKTYRWSGSDYVVISETLALGETSSTAYAGNKGKANADAIAALQTGKANKATTLSGYGITDAYTKTEVDTKVNAKATKATTLAGYGITDAYTKSEIDNTLAGYVPNDVLTLAGRARYEVTNGGINMYVEPANQQPFTIFTITPTNILWGNSRLATLSDVNPKADKATTLAGYGITDAYTKSQVDSAVSGAVPKTKAMATYTANYAISDGEIEIYLKNNNGTASKQLKITPTSVLWDNQDIATVNQIPDVSNKANKATTLLGYGITDAYTKAQANNLLGNKAAHTSVETSSDGKTITFTFD